MEQFTIENMKDAKYVVVGLEQRSDKDAKIVGYFLGLRSLVDTNIQIVSKDDMYVWVMKGETVHILNLDQYKIELISVRVNNSGTKYSDSSDELSLSRLKIVQEAMAKSGMVRPNGLIDTNKFTEVPTDIKKEVEDDMKTSYAGTSSKAATGSTTAYNKQAAGYTSGSTHTTYKKKEIITTTLKRTTKYPITAALEKMQEKIVAMQDGTYVPPKLPEIPGDKEGAAGEKKDDATITDQQYCEEMGGMCGLPYG